MNPAMLSLIGGDLGSTATTATPASDFEQSSSGYNSELAAAGQNAAGNFTTVPSTITPEAGFASSSKAAMQLGKNAAQTGTDILGLIMNWWAMNKQIAENKRIETKNGLLAAQAKQQEQERYNTNMQLNLQDRAAAKENLNYNRAWNEQQRKTQNAWGYITNLTNLTNQSAAWRERLKRAA